MAITWTQIGSWTEGTTAIIAQRGVENGEHRGYRLLIDGTAQTAVAHGRVAKGENLGGDVYHYLSAETRAKLDPGGTLPTVPFKVTLAS